MFCLTDKTPRKCVCCHYSCCIEIQPSVVNTTPSRFGLWDSTLLSSLPPGRGSLQTCSFSFLWLYRISGLGTVLSPNVFALLQEVLCLPGNRCNIYLWKCVALCEDCLCHLSRVWAASSGFMLPGSCISTVSTAKICLVCPNSYKRHRF